MKRLFLDDIRVPTDCINYMYRKIGADVLHYKYDWDVVKSYKQFVKYLKKNGVPIMVSFDHDLAPEHYINGDLGITDKTDFVEETGADCAKYLIEFCNNLNVPLPKYFIHSMNPVGAENIKHILNIKYKRWLKQ